MTLRFAQRFLGPVAEPEKPDAKPMPKLDEHGHPIVDPPKREDDEEAAKPMKRMGYSDDITEAEWAAMLNLWNRTLSTRMRGCLG